MHWSAEWAPLISPASELVRKFFWSVLTNRLISTSRFAKNSCTPLGKGGKLILRSLDARWSQVGPTAISWSWELRVSRVARLHQNTEDYCSCWKNEVPLSGPHQMQSKCWSTMNQKSDIVYDIPWGLTSDIRSCIFKHIWMDTFCIHYAISGQTPPQIQSLLLVLSKKELYLWHHNKTKTRNLTKFWTQWSDLPLWYDPPFHNHLITTSQISYYSWLEKNQVKVFWYSYDT